MPDHAAAQALATANLACVQTVYAEYALGNRAAVFEALAEDVAWTSVAGPELPWGGTYHGRDGVAAYFARLDAAVQITAYVAEHCIAQGEWVVTLARGHGRLLLTGREVVLDKADAMRLRDGRIAEFREYYDTAAVLAGLRAG